MKPLNNWESTQAAVNGAANNVTLTDGGHVVKILNSVVEERNGIQYLVLNIDIDEGSEFDGYYRAKYMNAKQFGDAKWSGNYRQSLTDKNGNANKFFKGLITMIEKSNSGYRWNWDESTLKGKKLGIVFRSEQYDYNGKRGMTVRPYYCCDVASVSDMPVPEPKMLPVTAASVASVMESMTEVTNEDIPF